MVNDTKRGLPLWSILHIVFSRGNKKYYSRRCNLFGNDFLSSRNFYSFSRYLIASFPREKPVVEFEDGRGSVSKRSENGGYSSSQPEATGQRCKIQQLTGDKSGHHVRLRDLQPGHDYSISRLSPLLTVIVFYSVPSSTCYRGT